MFHRMTRFGYAYIIVALAALIGTSAYLMASGSGSTEGGDKVPASCRALAAVGTWQSYSPEDSGPATWNGREISDELIADRAYFQQSYRTLHRACASWLYEYGRDELKHTDPNNK
jgi:hypothetical protein